MTFRLLGAAPIACAALIAAVVALASASTAGGDQTPSFQFNVYYSCNNERLIITRCSNESADAYCSVSYPDRKGPATNNITPTLAEKRGDLIKKLQACGALPGGKPSPAPTATPAPATSSAASQQAEAFRAQGNELYAAKDYARAADAYKQSLAARPTAMAFFSLGMTYLKFDRAPEATPLFLDALRLDANHAAAHGGLAIAYGLQDQYAQAIAAGNEAIRLGQRSADAYWRQGDLYMASGAFAEAVTAYGNASRLEPADSLYLYQLGLALVCAGRSDQARRVQVTLLKAHKGQAAQLLGDIDDPRGIPGVLLQMGQIRAMAASDVRDEGDLLGAARYDMEARGAFRNALRLRPTDPDILNDAAHGLHLADRPQEALAVFQKIVAMKPAAKALASAYWGMGSVHNSLKEHQKAVDVLIEAQRLEPDSTYSNELGSAYVGLKQYQNALAAFQDAVRLNPRNYGGHLNVGRAYLLLGQFDRAMPSFREASKVFPTLSRPHEQTGQAYLGLKDYANAAAAFSQAIKMDAEDADAHFGLGRAYLALGRKGDAAALVAPLKKLDAKLAQALLDLINKPPASFAASS